MKPLFGHGGAAVFKIGRDDPNFGSLYDLFATTFREPWVVQRYIPEIVTGDKRIILIDGIAAGAVNRVPAAGDIRSNMVRGGAAAAAELTPRETEICATIGPELARRGLVLVGIDVIAGHLTEINVTSPTGVRAIERLGGPNLAATFWDRVEAKRSAADSLPRGDADPRSNSILRRMLGLGHGSAVKRSR
jgi:glutathione synthase